MFEASLANQKNISNSNFLEYSDNIRIERFDTDNATKVKQISIYINNKWHNLIDENGNIKKETENMSFSLATCSFLANPTKRKNIRKGFEIFEELSARTTHKPELCKINGKTLNNTEAFVIGLQNAKKLKTCKIKPSTLITVENSQ